MSEAELLELERLLYRYLTEEMVSDIERTLTEFIKVVRRRRMWLARPLTRK